MRSLVITAALTLSALALPAAAQADLKLGYVDLQRALNEVEEGKAAKNALKREFDQKQKILDDKQEELKRLKADFDKQSVVMSEDVRRDRQNDMDRKLMEVQGLFMQLQKELSERERDATRGIFDKMNAIIREIAEADGFTMVFERGDAGLLFAPASLDLTNELIRKYNARHKGSPGAGGGSAPAAAADPKKDAGGGAKKADSKKPSGK